MYRADRRGVFSHAGEDAACHLHPDTAAAAAEREALDPVRTASLAARFARNF